MKTVLDRLVRFLSWVALGLCGLALADFVLHPLAPDFVYHSTLYRAASMLVLTPLTLLVGFLIIRRVPGNIVGPLLILWSGTVAIGALRMDIGPVPFALFTFYELVVGWFGLFLMVLHFPDGKIYPPGATRWVYGLAGMNFVLNGLIFLGQPSLLAGQANPIHLAGLEKLIGLFTWLSLLIAVPWLVLVLISPMLRYRKGSYLERQQIKWLALFGGFLVISTILGFVVYPALIGGQVMHREDNLFSMLFFFGTGLLPPVTIGVAVLRYRLWDIDILIRRTLVYTLLSGLLVVAYSSSVVVLQNTFGALTGQRESALVTVLSTLVIAVLFVPLRQRVQAFIDRRFYRRKYDAARTLTAYSATLRDETNLDQLVSHLTDVVDETMQPTEVTLWLK